jgi:ATP-dependent Clp protease adaptor protein ClpS
MVNSYLSVNKAREDEATPQRYRFRGLGILKHMVTPAKTRPGTREERSVETVDATDTPWVTIVWDDPVNLMTYVTYVFQKLFGYSEPHATKLMLQVHNEGKAVVSAGSRESMEVDVSKLHAAGLWATMQQDR